MYQSFYKGKRAPSFAIGSGPKTERDLTTRRIVPGPGQYNYNTVNRTYTGASFTKAERSPQKLDKVPGPG